MQVDKQKGRGKDATNFQGDVLRILDETGAIVAAYTYDPWGKLLSATGTLAETNPLRYRGYYYDAETGLYYLQSRYYDPAVRRFLNADGYTSTGQGIVGTNMFAYCLGNPILYFDSSGTRAVIQSADILGICASNTLDVLGCSNWRESSAKMGSDLSDALSAEDYFLIDFLNNNFVNNWNTTTSAYMLLHTHGSPVSLVNDETSDRFLIASKNRLRRNYHIKLIVSTACSVGGSNGTSMNMGQMLSTKISPDGYVVCATTTVEGGETKFCATNGGSWLIYQNGNLIGFLPVDTITMDYVAHYIQNLK